MEDEITVRQRRLPLMRVRPRRHPAEYLFIQSVFSWRNHKRLTQADLARLVGVNRKTINCIETGKTVPSLVLALRLAKVLDRPVESLFKLRVR